MQITKRNGTKEAVKLEKISKRIERHCKDLKQVDTITIAQKVIQGLYDGVKSTELDKLAMETSYAMSSKHPEYDKLATRLAISSLHKDTDSSFSSVIDKLYNVKDTQGKNKSLIDSKVYKFIKKNASILDTAIDYKKDFNFDFFGFKTLERSYLLKINNVVVERPQHMWMRVACGIHYDDIDDAINTYHMLSSLQATHATPTLFNAGTPKNQLSSCFLVAMSADSVKGIYDTLQECALISQSSGGIGFHIHNIRSKGSPIYGTNGTSNGLVPMLKVYEQTARYIDQCLTSDFIISTPVGDKTIEDINIGDEIKNLEGTNSVVKNKKIFDYDGDLIEIYINNTKITTTPNHPILILKNATQFSDEMLKIKLSNGFITPQWIEAKDVNITDVCLGLYD